MGEEQRKKSEKLENIKKIGDSKIKINYLLSLIKKPLNDNEEVLNNIRVKKARLYEEIKLKREQELLFKQQEEEINQAKANLMKDNKKEIKSDKKEKEKEEEKIIVKEAKISEKSEADKAPLKSVEEKPHKVEKKDSQIDLSKEKMAKIVNKPKSEMPKPKPIKAPTEKAKDEKPQYEVKVSKLWKQPSYDKRGARPTQSTGGGYQGRNNNTFNQRPNTSSPGFDNNNRFNNNNQRQDFKKPPTSGFTPVDKPFVPAFPKDTKKKPPVKDKANASFNAKKTMNKKSLEKKGFVHGSRSAIEYDESGEIRKIRTRKVSNEKKKAFAPQPVLVDHVILNFDNVTIRSFSEKIGKPGAEIVKHLFDLGIFKTLNDNIDFETAELVAGELGVTLELQAIKTSEEKLIESHVEDVQEDSKDLVTRPPVVTIMGHVDHGKTSLLDFIRKANVAGGEAGGITQHIGAYTIKLNKRPITFLDTPGHAAFTAMRARGANVTDIAIIIAAADDGIMPQTIEAINHAKAANVPIIVAVNKIDKDGSKPDRVLQQLTEHDVIPEAWGGTVPVVNVSAITGEGIEELLETIFVLAEVCDIKSNPNRTASGIIIEAKLDKGKGPVATVLVKNGTLRQADYIVAGTSAGRIRAMVDDKGRKVKEAGPSMPVSILGLQSVPNAGDQMMVVDDDKLSKQVVEERKNKEKIAKLQVNKVSLDDVFRRIEEGKFKNLNLIIKADVQGSVEAIKQSMVKLSNDEVKVVVVHGGVGAINESDVMLAQTSESIIIGFNVRPDSNAKSIAEKNGVDIRCYRIIYDAIDDVEKAIKGLLAPKFKEIQIGRAEVREVFKVSSIGSIAGCMVKEGKIERNAQLRLLRDNVVIFEGKFGSLKRFKDDAKEVQSGYECGISIENYNNIEIGDVIEAFKMEQIV